MRKIKARRVRWKLQTALTGKMRNVYRTLNGKPEGKKPLEKTTRK
jgi:hypothetical protein